jgi:uncharacterized protein YegJ (DUF2314 family)
MKISILTIIFTLFLFGLFACTSNENTNKESEDNLYRTPSEDMGMNNAISNAQSTLEQFDKALKSNQYDKNSFALKVKFPTSNGAEHIWATDIIVKDGHYFGIVDNLPELTTKVKLGDKIQLEKANISDWMYSENGTLRGGYTMKLIRSRMSKEEQKAFDADFHYKIED